MKNKTYTIAGKKLTQGELSLNDSKKMVGILKDLDWQNVFNGENTMYEIAKDYLDSNVLEDMLQVILKGEWPDGEIGDIMSASQVMEVITDFFDLNVSLMENVQRFLINLAPSSEASGDQKKK